MQRLVCIMRSYRLAANTLKMELLLAYSKHVEDIVKNKTKKSASCWFYYMIYHYALSKQYQISGCFSNETKF
jgi:hypothetical protein